MTYYLLFRRRECQNSKTEITFQPIQYYTPLPINNREFITLPTIPLQIERGPMVRPIYRGEGANPCQGLAIVIIIVRAPFKTERGGGMMRRSGGFVARKSKSNFAPPSIRSEATGYAPISSSLLCAVAS